MPPQQPRGPHLEPPASTGPGTQHQVLLVSTALGMTHYSVSRGRIWPKICVPRVHLAVSQLPISPFLRSLPSPTRVLHTHSRSPQPSPLWALRLSFPAGIIRSGLYLRLSHRPPPVSSPPRPPHSPFQRWDPAPRLSSHRFPRGARRRRRGENSSPGFPAGPRCVRGGCSGRSRAVAPGRVLLAPAVPLPELVRRGAGRTGGLSLLVPGAGSVRASCGAHGPGPAPPFRPPRGRDAAAPAFSRAPARLRAARLPPEPPTATAGSPSRQRGSCWRCGAPAPLSAEEAPADGAARVPELRRRAAGGCRGAPAAPLIPRRRPPPPPSGGAGKSPGRTRATSIGAAKLRGRCRPRPAPPRGAPPRPSPWSSDAAPAPPPPSPGGARTRSPPT